MIRFRCPRCQKSLAAPPEKAGHKSPCPKCGQRVQVPAPDTSKTLIGELDNSALTMLGEVQAPANPPANVFDFSAPVPVAQPVIPAAAPVQPDNEHGYFVIPCWKCGRACRMEETALRPLTTGFHGPSQSVRLCPKCDASRTRGIQGLMTGFAIAAAIIVAFFCLFLLAFAFVVAKFG